MDRPDFDLGGRVALITGSGRGIGLAMGHALAAHGCAVALQDIEQDVAEAEADALRRDGARATALGGDIADPDLPQRLVDRTIRQLGGIHILINNAAIQQSGNWVEFAPTDIQRIIAADQIAPLRLCQIVVPIFRAQRFGRIINLGSIQQRGGVTLMLPYAMCKAALENMTRGLARELAKDGITVNLIAPGWFNTYRNREGFKDPQAVIRAGQNVPMGRIGEPVDAAGLAVLLASPAGAYITGQSIYVDGGMSTR